jgi:hypothetical protein
MASKSLEISAEDVRVIGLCTGSLAASAFCCTITLDDLHRIAIPIVCVAFQVGILAASAASASYQQDGYEAKWSCAFAHVSESRMEDLLEEFHTNVSWLSLVLMPSYYLISSRFKLERALVTYKERFADETKSRVRAHISAIFQQSHLRASLSVDTQLLCRDLSRVWKVSNLLGFLFTHLITMERLMTQIVFSKLSRQCQILISLHS